MMALLVGRQRDKARHILQLFREKAHFYLLTTKAFRLFRWFNVFVAPVHFYTPLPDIRELDAHPGIWSEPSQLPGLNMADEVQRWHMNDVFSAYQDECDFPSQPHDASHIYHTANHYFGYVSAAAMHSMVRHYRPRKIVEIGCGNSTYVIARAALMNQQEGTPTELIAIDPYPTPTLQSGFPGLSCVVPLPVQAVDLEMFAQLEAGDILSIDTSHAVRTGGDVTHIYLQVLPRLKPGVLVHIHDIFLPFEYPREWVSARYFWNEQYLLHAFLLFNSDFGVVWGQRYSEHHFPTLFQSTFSHRTTASENHNSYSLWIRRNA